MTTRPDLPAYHANKLCCISADKMSLWRLPLMHFVCAPVSHMSLCAGVLRYSFQTQRQCTAALLELFTLRFEMPLPCGPCRATYDWVTILSLAAWQRCGMVRLRVRLAIVWSFGSPALRKSALIFIQLQTHIIQLHSIARLCLFTARFAMSPLDNFR